jgi:tetratricopeptide (TPR) repeat protein
VAELQRQVDTWYGEIKPHKDIVTALTRTRNGTAQSSDVRALLNPGTDNPLIQTSALHEFVMRYLSPDMPEIDPAIQDSLLALTSNRDLDVRSFALAALHLARGDDASVRPFLVSTLANAEDDLLTRTRWIWALRHYGDRYLNAGNPARAAAAYAKALELQSDHPGIVTDLANVFAATGDHETALQYFQQSLTIDPGQPAVLVNMAVSLEQSGRLNDAISAYHQAIDLNPRESLAHNNLGNIHFRQGEYRLAIERYSQAVAHSPDLSTANLLLAQSYLLVNRPDSALIAVRRALEFDPDSEAGRRMLRDLTNDR